MTALDLRLLSHLWATPALDIERQLKQHVGHYKTFLISSLMEHMTETEKRTMLASYETARDLESTLERSICQQNGTPDSHLGGTEQC